MEKIFVIESIHVLSMSKLCSMIDM
jgi:hypothetical protein